MTHPIKKHYEAINQKSYSVQIVSFFLLCIPSTFIALFSLSLSLSLSLSSNHPLLFLSTFHLVYWILWSFILYVKTIAKKFRSFRCGNIKTKNVKRLYSPLKMNEYPHKYINLYNQILKMIHLNTSTQKYKSNNSI